MTFEPTKGSLPRRDLFLLPLISVATVLLLIGLAEIVARKVWPEKLSDECFFVDPVLGNRFKPHCSVMRKNAEGPWVRYEYNDCGYRGSVPCGPKPAGSLRIVLMGSSAAFGLDVAYDQHFATRAAPELAQVLGHPVEFQNMGAVGRDWSKNEMVLDEAMSLKPDAIFYIVMPFDLLRMDRLESIQPPGSGTATAAVMKVGAWIKVRHLVASSRLAYMAQHFLLQDESFLLHAIQNYGDPLDASRQPTPPLTERRFALLDMMMGKLAERARAAGVPCFLIAIPNRAETVMIRTNAQLPQLNAYIFPNRMQDVAQKNGLAYIDLLPYLKSAANVGDLYYPVDGHPTASLHQLLTRALVDYFRKAGSLSEAIQTAGLN